jgi:hypothetical protein
LTQPPGSSVVRDHSLAALDTVTVDNTAAMAVKRRHHRHTVHDGNGPPPLRSTSRTASAATTDTSLDSLSLSASERAQAGLLAHCPPGTRDTPWSTSPIAGSA